MGGVIYQLFKKQVAFQLLFVISPQPPFGVGHSYSLAARPLGLDAPLNPTKPGDQLWSKADRSLEPGRRVSAGTGTRRAPLRGHSAPRRLR